MASSNEKNMCNDQAPGSGASGRYPIEDEYSALASAVSALTAADLNGLSDSLSATDSRNTDSSGVHDGAGILANQF